MLEGIHIFIQQILLTTYYGPNTVPGTKGTTVNKTGIKSCLSGVNLQMVGVGGRE